MKNYLQQFEPRLNNKKNLEGNRMDSQKPLKKYKHNQSPLLRLLLHKNRKRRLHRRTSRLLLRLQNNLIQQQNFRRHQNFHFHLFHYKSKSQPLHQQFGFHLGQHYMCLVYSNRFQRIRLNPHLILLTHNNFYYNIRLLLHLQILLNEHIKNLYLIGCQKLLLRQHEHPFHLH